MWGSRRCEDKFEMGEFEIRGLLVGKRLSGEGGLQAEC
jgi:hypothetical protein